MIIIDCRTKQEQSAGQLPNTLLLNQKAFHDIDARMDVVD